MAQGTNGAAPLAGRTAVVTGAASGIGRALAQRLARHGSPVAICDWNEDGLEETAAAIAGPVFARKLDVSDRQAQLQFAAAVQEWAPAPIGLVVNNAGVTVSQTAADAAVEDDEWVVNVNFWGVVHGTRAYLPILLRQRSGTIANVSSVFGLMGFPTQSAYCASKFAVRGYTESLRHELRGSGVHATTIHPGGIKTNIVRNARFHVDDQGGTDHERMVREFARLARTSPEKAAKTIHEGVLKGRQRILIGPDATAISLLTRTAPVRYFDVIERLSGLVRR
ncbi:SDR family NAD(P)-dependent oxidoreductase [Conexibacter sp. JD483]|uniref:SDR family NAD(P)-dependent oxidoreductase n=1 Tax=unclassified Conexibacter TaxID=2627773 RepID=UPI00271D5BDA|nr:MULTISPECIES: SDR family NAD(P)-dependent oxidoreductase [unclassified Conexibacter]MDO8185239.1 SDR family NAD(P)-dependent oxidoreductase [Conexibacter sp. CPCC 205706]MDO8198285.1 SDR family NAD(P)-dependent oxidoreductase [Conexibacter sp. CPCC 205762]MDR9367753.1 SDR family NAD(P)-dependent oxidoreductase [Conexibacter sp. JD483]